MKAKDPAARVAAAMKGAPAAEPSTRDRILGAALSIIEKEGAGRATVRAIAAEAGVNVAAINYHYRTKEELMEAAIGSSWKHAAEDLRKFLEVDPEALGSGIEALLLYLLRGGKTFPNITSAYLLGAGSLGPSPLILEGQKAFVEEFAGIIADALGIPRDEALIARTGALYFFCLYTALVPGSLPRALTRDDFAFTARILSEDYLRDVVP